MMCAWATKCHAADSTLRVESGATYVRGEAPVLAVTITLPKAGPIDTDYQFGIVLIGSSRYNGVDQGNQAALQFQLVDGFGKFEMGLGVAYLQVTDDYNGSHGNFSLQLAYRFTDRQAVIIRHFSNLGTVSPNTGRDLYLYSWRF